MILKKFKGSYFLNEKRNEDHWVVKRLDIEKDALLIGKVLPGDTLLRFDFVQKTEELNEKDSTITTEYLLTPNKRNFKKLMQTNSFELTECYYRGKS